MSNISVRFHDITSIGVVYGEADGTRWIEFTLHGSDGASHEVTAFVERPLEIAGAELINLMAAHEKEPSLTSLLQASIEAAKAKKGQHA